MCHLTTRLRHRGPTGLPCDEGANRGCLQPMVRRITHHVNTTCNSQPTKREASLRRPASTKLLSPPLLPTLTVAFRPASSRAMLCTTATTGPRALRISSDADSDQGMITICSPLSPRSTVFTRTPRGPTQDPTGSTPGSCEETVIMQHLPASRAIPRISTMPLTNSGTCS